MKKTKAIALVMTIAVMAMALTSCMHSDVGIRMNADGSGSITATAGIKKEAYEYLQSLDSEGDSSDQELTEYVYDGVAYVGATVSQEYTSYEDMEQALLNMRFDDFTSEVEDAEGLGLSSESASIFKDAKLLKEGNLFKSVYSFSATLNAQESVDDSEDGDSVDLGSEVNDMYLVTITVEMPGEIGEVVGGTAEGNAATFVVNDLAQEVSLSAICETTNAVVWVEICAGVVLVLCIVCAVMRVARGKGKVEAED